MYVRTFNLIDEKTLYSLICSWLLQWPSKKRRKKSSERRKLQFDLIEGLIASDIRQPSFLCVLLTIHIRERERGEQSMVVEDKWLFWLEIRRNRWPIGNDTYESCSLLFSFDNLLPSIDDHARRLFFLFDLCKEKSRGAFDALLFSFHPLR